MKQKLLIVISSRLNQAMWPFAEKEHREILQELRAFSQWIQLSLSVDAAALLSKTSDDVIAMLTAQLENVKMLKSLDSTTASIETTLDMQTSLLNEARDQEQRDKVLAWMSGFDQDVKHNEVRAPRIEGTGQWLFKTESFCDWYRCGDGDTKTVLWCSGVQGAGKSVLT